MIVLKTIEGLEIFPAARGLQHDVIYAAAPWGLSPDEKILPQYLKELGYTTRGIGKSGTNGLDFHDDDENVWNYTGHYGTEIFTTKAKEIIKTHDTSKISFLSRSDNTEMKGWNARFPLVVYNLCRAKQGIKTIPVCPSKPLFLYLAHQAVHAGNSYTPLQAPPEYVNRFPHIQDEDRRIFAGMASALDDSIGDLFYTLNESGILQNAVIVFTTDNGAAVQGIDASTGSNWPLRGSKYNMWEGGVRGVAFVWSPLIRGAEHISSGMMHMSDWLPTLYSVAGKNYRVINPFLCQTSVT
ncbi:UNVERIFIED_CONTAM: Arsb [Trichonephila clavipes]